LGDDAGDALDDEWIGRAEREAFEEADEEMVVGCALDDRDRRVVVFLAEVDADASEVEGFGVVEHGVD
jgi:hypothetical protein